MLALVVAAKIHIFATVGIPYFSSVCTQSGYDHHSHYGHLAFYSSTENSFATLVMWQHAVNKSKSTCTENASGKKGNTPHATTVLGAQPSSDEQDFTRILGFQP